MSTHLSGIFKLLDCATFESDHSVSSAPRIHHARLDDESLTVNLRIKNEGWKIKTMPKLGGLGFC